MKKKKSSKTKKKIHTTAHKKVVSKQKPLSRFIYWMPRVLAILIALWLLIYAFASQGTSAISSAQGIVWLLVLVAVIIAWRWPTLGGSIFIAYGLIYLLISWGKTPLGVQIMVSGPLVILGWLFLLSKLIKK